MPHAIVFANGLGGSVSAFGPYIRALEGRHRVLSWDYRGLYGSHFLGGRTPDLEVSTHARDVLQVLNCAQIEQVTFVGWSMGVQIGLELFRLQRRRIRGLVLMNGTFGRPFRGVAFPFSERLLRPLVRSASSFSDAGTRLLQRASRIESTSLWLKRLGLLAPAFDGPLFRQMLEDFKSLDLKHYFSMLSRLSEHDAEDMLKAIDVPTLIVSGALDWLTPPGACRTMARRIRGAEFLLVPRATHYAAAEFPELLAKRIDAFIQNRVQPSHRPLEDAVPSSSR